jgi:dCTP deaminase
MSFLPQSRLRALGPTLFPGEAFEQSLLNQASYDLRLGEEYFLVGTESPQRLTEGEPYLCLPPGQFALLTTFETVDVPAFLIGFISVRTQFKLQGLVNISGFHVDPTFRGTLQFAVQNLSSSDIRLKFKEPTFTIFFAEVSDGDIGKHREPDRNGISLKHVQMFGGNSVTITNLHKEVDKLRMLITIYGGIAAAAVVGILIKLLIK